MDKYLVFNSQADAEEAQKNIYADFIARIPDGPYKQQTTRYDSPVLGPDGWGIVHPNSLMSAEDAAVALTKVKNIKIDGGK